MITKVVIYNNCEAEVFYNSFGIPQGGNLGPLLIIINDISENKKKTITINK